MKDYSYCSLFIKAVLNALLFLFLVNEIMSNNNEKLKKKSIKLVKEEWRSIKIDDFNIENYRSSKYILIYSKNKKV